MMMRVKLVIRMTNAGMKLSAVMISRICRLTEYSCCPSAPLDRVMAGIDNGSAARASGAASSSAKVNNIRSGPLITSCP
ncbi:hypothetical protein D3C80_288470 [compost metagenome]